MIHLPKYDIPAVDPRDTLYLGIFKRVAHVICMERGYGPRFWRLKFDSVLNGGPMTMPLDGRGWG